jgi:hypothetical protein
MNYLNNQINTIVVDRNKRSILPWKVYQTRMITPAELHEQQQHPKAYGVAIICGAVSGGLEVIDIDCKNDTTGAMRQSLIDTIKEQSEDLYRNLYIVQTQNNGLHIAYRCEVIEGNQKLASRYATNQEQASNPHIKQVVLIETRGEGGYVVAPPTDGYIVLQGASIPTLTIDEREMLHSICRQYNQITEEAPRPRQVIAEADYGLSPFEDFNQRGDAVAVLQSHGWTVVRETTERVILRRPGKSEGTSGDYLKDKRWFGVFTTSTQFEPQKAYNPAAVFCMLECNGDWKRAAQQLTADGYGEKKKRYPQELERELYDKWNDGADVKDLVKILIKKFDYDFDDANTTVNSLLKQWGPVCSTFWDAKKVKGSMEITINMKKLKDFLSYTGGFFLYFYDNNTNLYKVIQIKDGLVRESSTEKIKKYIIAYIETLPSHFDGGCTRDLLIEKILKGNSIYFSSGFFEFLDSTKPDFLRSTKDLQYFAFRNGVVEISAKDIVLRTYGELNKVIWENQVIEYDISIDTNFDPESAEYYKFLRFVSGQEYTRLLYCMSLIGYLLHTYKDPARPYAVILAEETENDTEGGGTGKGLFVKALSQLARTVKLDGKTFKIDANFALQRVNLDTQIIAVEDCERNLDFEKFNSQITEGTTIDKKNKDQLFIDYKDAPKFMFSTNYMLNIKGNHGKRRTKVFEFAPHFGADKTPQTEFGHLLFDEWDADEWNRFYNFMFNCIVEYLKNGIMAYQQTEKLKRKQLKNQFGEEFLNMLEDLKPGVHYVLMDEYKAFMLRNEFEKRDYSNRKFKKAIEIASDVFGMGVAWSKNIQNNKRMEFKFAQNCLISESSESFGIELEKNDSVAPF